MRLYALIFASLLMLTACNKEPPKPSGPSVEEAAAAALDTEAEKVVHDDSSYSEPEKVVIRHLALELAVDFDKQVLAGTVTLDLSWIDSAATALVLDSRDLQISKVEASAGETEQGTLWQDLPFTLAPVDPVFGSKLSISANARFAQVRITYSTSPNASGLQWMTPAMTLGKSLPFMFSQSQAIHARSWVPLQDTPGVRFTYDAHITTPGDVMALMSADNDPATARSGDYNFKMDQPIPSYLMAIAVGDLVFKPITERAGVWAEPALVDKAVKEFEDVGKMMTTAETLYGTYRWKRYDILVLPPSFPFGGMENPRLTFATPTIIVGDKSLASLIAHELAHSWSGNLVTNSSWKDIWLNEGFTSYVENRITEAVYGKDLADMERVIGEHELTEELKELDPKDQVLMLAPLGTSDPDATLSGVPYTKGQWFLTFLEKRFGREIFDAFLRDWFDYHALTSVTSAEFERFLHTHLLEANPGKVTAEELNAWMREPGLPAFAVTTTSTRFDAVDRARSGWLDGTTKLAEIESSKWSTMEWVRFIEGMPETLKAEQIAQLDAAYHFTGTPNGEIAQRWYPLTVRSGYLPARPAIAKFIIEIGRRKLILPTYKALVKSPEGLAFAREQFAIARPAMHPITIASVEALLNIKPVVTPTEASTDAAPESSLETATEIPTT